MCDRLVNASVDLLPSLLDCAGIPIPESLPGQSVWPMAQRNAIPDWRDWVIGQVHFCHPKMPNTTPHTYGRMARSAHNSYWLLDQGQQRELLFDTHVDQGETVNLASSPESRETLLQHRAFLKEHAVLTGDAQAAEMLQALDENG